MFRSVCPSNRSGDSSKMMFAPILEGCPRVLIACSPRLRCRGNNSTYTLNGFNVARICSQSTNNQSSRLSRTHLPMLPPRKCAMRSTSSPTPSPTPPRRRSVTILLHLSNLRSPPKHRDILAQANAHSHKLSACLGGEFGKYVILSVY